MSPQLLIMLVIVGVVVSIWCGIAHRLGYPAALGIVAIIPLVNLIMLLIWALSESPNERKLREYQRRDRMRHDDIAAAPVFQGSVGFER